MKEALFQFVDNPLVVMGIRRRLRPWAMVSAAAITMVIVLFVYGIVILTAFERGFASLEHAAQLAFVPVLIIQCLILMVLGTGQVIQQFSQEQEAQRLDYHRMSKMSSSAKTIGYLLGLPAREYFVFALTLPFTLFSVVVGGLPVFDVFQLYLVLLSSVLLFHCAALVAQMLASGTKLSGRRGLSPVLFAIYIGGRMADAGGLSLLQYFTPKPVFDGLIRDQLAAVNIISAAKDGARTVGFFGLEVPQTVFSLVLQGMMFAIFFIIVTRRWRSQDSHPLAKVQALGFFAAIVLISVGTLWPKLVDTANSSVASGKHFFASQLESISGEEVALAGAPSVLLFLSYFIFMVLVGFAFLYLVTPTRPEYVQGLRRARRLGLSGLLHREEASSALPVAFSVVGLISIGYWILCAGLPTSSGAPFLLAAAMPVLYLASMVIFFQSAMERFGGWRLLGLLLAAWGVPLLVGVVLVAAWGTVLPAAYLAAPNPLAAFAYTLASLFGELPTELSGHLTSLSMTSTAITIIGAWAMHKLLRKRIDSDRSTVFGADESDQTTVQAATKAIGSA